MNVRGIAAICLAGLVLIGSPRASSNFKQPAEFQAQANPWDPWRRYMYDLMQYGVSIDLAAPYHTVILQRCIQQWTDAQLQSIVALLQSSGNSPTAHLFLLKSLVVSEPWENLVAFAAEMNGVSDEELVRRCTMRDAPDLVQQWQDSCGPSMLQTAAGEMDPRYAWELNKLGNVAVVDPYGGGAGIAGQQKAWLDGYGGVAVPRGATGGKGIQITQFLNDQLAPITWVRYEVVRHTLVGGVEGMIDNIDQLLRAGYDVPLCISWDESETSNHYVIALSVYGDRGSRQFLIHDTWTGGTAWVKEDEIRNKTMPQFFGGYASVTFFYKPIPMW